MIELIVTAIAVLIAIGLILRFGGSSIGLLKAGGSALYQETSLLTLANSSNAQYPNYG
jgi:hypothetical protein